MRRSDYRPPIDCREVWLRLANTFPAMYEKPPLKPRGDAREAISYLEIHFRTPRAAADAFRNWLTERDSSRHFEKAITTFSKETENAQRIDDE